LGHAAADTLVTPMNDSFLDFDLLAKFDAESLEIQGPSLWSKRSTRRLLRASTPTRVAHHTIEIGPMRHQAGAWRAIPDDIRSKGWDPEFRESRHRTSPKGRNPETNRSSALPSVSAAA